MRIKQHRQKRRLNFKFIKRIWQGIGPQESEAEDSDTEDETDEDRYENPGYLEQKYNDTENFKNPGVTVSKAKKDANYDTKDFINPGVTKK